METFLAIVFVVIVLIALFIHMLEDSETRSKQWKTLAEGEFDRVEYGFYEYTTRSGTMVHSTQYHKVEMTIFFFSDGRSQIVYRRWSMPYPKGTHIRISVNGNDKYALEKI